MKKEIVLAGLVIALATTNVFGGNPNEYKEIKNTMKLPLFKKSGRGSSDKVIGVGVQMGMCKLLGGGPMLIGFGVNGLFSPDGEKTAFYVDFNYYLGASQSSQTTVHALSSQTYPSSMNIDIKTTISGMGFSAGYRRYLINDVSEEGFKMYFQAGLGILLFSEVSTTDAVNPMYDSPSLDPATATGITLGGGIGFEYSLASKINIFVEGNIAIPANKSNGQTIEVEIPITLQPKFGVRYHF